MAPRAPRVREQGPQTQLNPHGVRELFQSLEKITDVPSQENACVPYKSAQHSEVLNQKVETPYFQEKDIKPEEWTDCPTTHCTAGGRARTPGLMPFPFPTLSPLEGNWDGGQATQLVPHYIQDATW